MSRWSSFDDEQAYTDSWRRYLMEEGALDEGWRDRVKGVAQGAADKVKSASGHASGAGQKGSAALDSALGKTADIWDSIAGFLGGNPTDKDYSHLRMPAGQIGVADSDSDAEEEDTSDEPTEPGTPPEEDTSDEPTDTGAAQDKVISTDPPSAQGTNQSQSLQNPEQEKLAQWAAQQRRTAVAMADDREWHRRFNKEQEKWSEEQWKAWHASPALNESQAYDRWKVLSGIKKKVI